ncbi:MAG: zinc ribbon domain-containing protein [Anaerolineales bacterium]|nr:zinc ribbon domain-containing protein [Anaerolineales bacterium]
MPVYTYRCDNCGVRFEREQRFTDPPLTRCPECSQKTLRKVYLPVGIVFKGSGFYATDHRSPSGQGKKHPAEKDSEKSGDKTGEIKKEPASAGKDKKD